MKYISIFIFLGVCLFGYSLSMKPYTDEELFEKKYMELSSGQSREYFDLRESMLTLKYRIQDIGITFFSIALLVGIVFKRGHNSFKSPHLKSGYVLLAIGLPFLTVFGHVFGMVQGLLRQEFPHWADSLGIPLAGASIQLVILLAWSLLHLCFLAGCKISPCNLALSKSHNFWLIGLFILTALVVTIGAFYGQYWYVLPGILWLYFYLSLAATRYKKANT